MVKKTRRIEQRDKRIPGSLITEAVRPAALLPLPEVYTPE